MVMRMLPIFFTTILFWTIYCQVHHTPSGQHRLHAQMMHNAILYMLLIFIIIVLFWTMYCLQCIVSHPNQRATELT